MTPLRERDVDNIADTVRALVWSLRRFGERQAGLEPLPHSELEVLRAVVDHPDITVSELARMLTLQSSNVSTTVRRLVERELIERTPDPRDGRSSRLRITPRATRHRQLIDAVWVDGIRDQLTRMSDDEVELVAKAAPLFRRFAEMG